MDEQHLIVRAAQGDLDAYALLVRQTQAMVCAVVRRIVHQPADAADALQETYLCAFRRLRDLRQPSAFRGWLRRIAINAAIAQLRRDRWVALEDPCAVPVLDEQESAWTDEQRLALAEALIELDPEDRLICDRFYHGGWSLARLAGDAGINEPAMRKRLQRIRERLREDIEMSEQKHVSGEQIGGDLPKKIVELLSKPRLTELPENPVGRMWDTMRALLDDYQVVEVPEIVDAQLVATTFGEGAVQRGGAHCIDETKYLRTDMTMPLLLSLKAKGGPQKLLAAGKTYRAGKLPTARSIEAFHQCEILLVQENLREWDVMELLQRIIQRILPGRPMRLEEQRYTICSRAWEVAVKENGEWIGVLGWGRYTDRVVEHIGGDPRRWGAAGAGIGLERLASIHFGIADVRTIEAARL